MTKQKKIQSTASPVSSKKKVVAAESHHENKKQLAIDLTHSLAPPRVPVAALGASAGGLEALEGVLEVIPADAALAVVVIIHLDPHHSSMLAQLLQKNTQLKVQEITEEVQAAPGSVYVIPPDKHVIIQQGVLKLVKRRNHSGILPIDLFFHSLAEEQDRKIIGVILSGTGMDGTKGARAISTAGGLIIVQDPATAKYDGMPTNAINTGLADYILAPDKITEQILKYISCSLPDSLSDEQEGARELQPVYRLLNTHIGHDFSLYKHATLRRRIEKRMSLHQINNVAMYARYLQHNPAEIHTLFKNLLISVTNFFRDPEAFESLKQILLKKIIKAKQKGYEIRVWVPACATGEEAYSIAILLQECMDEMKTYHNVQIFGTDVDEEAIETARLGLYPSNIVADISKQRLERFFTKEESLYKVKKEIRKVVIFSRQDIIKDPPFTKLDLLSCRNLLIYFTTELQQKLLPLFHYSLDYTGILFLGSAESINDFSDLFYSVDKKWKIYERKEGASAYITPLGMGAKTTIEKDRFLSLGENKQKPTNIGHLVETVLLENYAPVCIVLDEKEDIVYIHGHSGKYLEPASGLANLNILQMARSGLKLKLTAALNSVAAKNKQFSYNNLRIKSKDGAYYINLIVRPFRELRAQQHWKLVVIEDIIPSETLGKLNVKNSSTNKLADQMRLLEKTLKESKEDLQSTIEELEISNEGLKSSNEELQSTNEEMQSINEELETAKEELQSLNEELTTVNSELESRVEELSSANDDIQNLLSGTEIATVFLDNELRIKRFTPKATELMSLIQTDIGRPINDIVSKLEYDSLVEDAKKVLDTLYSQAIEIKNKKGQWFQLRMTPYRTVTNIIDGVVVTFLNIDLQKKVEEKNKQLNEMMQNASDNIKLMIDTLHEPLLILDKELRVTLANINFYKTFKLEENKTKSQSIYTIWEGKVSKDLLQKLLEDNLYDSDYACDFNIDYSFGKNKIQKIRINVRRINYTGLDVSYIFLAITFDDNTGENSND